MRILKFLLKSGHPGEGIGVMSPESGVVTRLRSEQYPSIVKTADEAEQGDPVARRVVETIAVLHASGVPRGFLRIPADEDIEDAGSLGFAGPEVDDVLDRLCEARLLGVNGDRVVMDPTVALAVRLRAEDTGGVQELTTAAATVLYTHAISIRLRANGIAFGDGDPAESGAIADEARALLDQAVTLAWHTQYSYDKAMDTILQCNASLAEVGQFKDALVLGKQMAALCSQRLGGAHPLTHEAHESVRAIKQLRSS